MKFRFENLVFKGSRFVLLFILLCILMIPFPIQSAEGVPEYEKDDIVGNWANVGVFCRYGIMMPGNK